MLNGKAILAALILSSISKPIEREYVPRVVYVIHTVYQPKGGFGGEWAERTRRIELHSWCSIQGRQVELIHLEEEEPFPVPERQSPYLLLTIPTCDGPRLVRTRSLRGRTTVHRIPYAD